MQELVDVHADPEVREKVWCVLQEACRQFPSGLNTSEKASVTYIKRADLDDYYAKVGGMYNVNGVQKSTMVSLLPLKDSLERDMIILVRAEAAARSGSRPKRSSAGTSVEDAIDTDLTGADDRDGMLLKALKLLVRLLDEVLSSLRVLCGGVTTRLVKLAVVQEVFDGTPIEALSIYHSLAPQIVTTACQVRLGIPMGDLRAECQALHVPGRGLLSYSCTSSPSTTATTNRWKTRGQSSTGNRMSSETAELSRVVHRRSADFRTVHPLAASAGAGLPKWCLRGEDATVRDKFVLRDNAGMGMCGDVCLSIARACLSQELTQAEIPHSANSLASLLLHERSLLKAKLLASPLSSKSQASADLLDRIQSCLMPTHAFTGFGFRSLELVEILIAAHGMGCDVACLQMQDTSVVRGKHGATVGSLHYNRIARCNEEGDTVDTSWTLSPNGTTTPSATWDAVTTPKRWLCLYLEENKGSTVKHWQILSRKDDASPYGETVVMTEMEYADFKNHFEHLLLARACMDKRSCLLQFSEYFPAASDHEFYTTHCSGFVTDCETFFPPAEAGEALLRMEYSHAQYVESETKFDEASAHSWLGSIGMGDSGEGATGKRGLADAPASNVDANNKKTKVATEDDSISHPVHDSRPGPSRGHPASVLPETKLRLGHPAVNQSTNLGKRKVTFGSTEKDEE